MLDALQAAVFLLPRGCIGYLFGSSVVLVWKLCIIERRIASKVALSRKFINDVVLQGHYSFRASCHRDGYLRYRYSQNDVKKCDTEAPLSRTKAPFHLSEDILHVSCRISGFLWQCDKAKNQNHFSRLKAFTFDPRPSTACATQGAYFFCYF